MPRCWFTLQEFDSVLVVSVLSHGDVTPRSTSTPGNVVVGFSDTGNLTLVDPSVNTVYSYVCEVEVPHCAPGHSCTALDVADPQAPRGADVMVRGTPSRKPR